MCGRFTRTNDFFSEHVAAHKLAEQLSLFEPLPPLPPSYNIAPTQQIAAVRADDHDRHELVWLRWGLVPGWADDLSIGNRMINAALGVGGDEAGVPPCLQAAALPDSGRRVLRMAEDGES